MDERIDKLHNDYRAALFECGKQGRAVLITSTRPDGQEARFDCVMADDPRYKTQHLKDQVDPPPPTDLDRPLQSLIGQKVKSAVARFGGPQGEPIINGDVVYIWTCFTNYLLPHTLIVDDVLTSSCEIRLATDRESGVIKTSEYTERRGGCRTFGERFEGRND